MPASVLRGRSLPGVLFGLAFGCASTGIPEEDERKLLTVAWPMDSVARVGGYATQPVGAPAISDEANAKVVCFDGKDDSLVLPVSPLTELHAFSIEALVKVAPHGHKTQTVLHMEDTFADARTLVELHRLEDGRWRVEGFVRNKIGQVKLEPAAATIAADGWYWLGMTFSGETVRLFIDGREHAQAKMSAKPMDNGRLAIGARLDRQHWFGGCVKELRFANGALPPHRLARVN